jgi:hypothetical protein
MLDGGSAADAACSAVERSAFVTMFAAGEKSLACGAAAPPGRGVIAQIASAAASAPRSRIPFDWFNVIDSLLFFRISVPFARAV